MTALLDVPAVETRPRHRAPDPRREFRRGAVGGAVGLALAWPLGLVYLGWVLVAAVMVLVCARRRWTTFPRTTAAWMGTLTLLLLSAAQVETGGRAVAFAYRYAIYLSATVVCLFLFNARRSFHTAMGVVAGVYVVVVASGVAGLLLPDYLHPSVLLRALPSLPTEARFVVDTTSMRLAELQNILNAGARSPRPKGVFAYTNDWASVYAVVTVVLLSYLQQQRRLRPFWLAVAGVGVWPLLESLSRAAWASLVLGLAVAIAVRGLRGGLRPVLPALVVVGVGAAVILTGPALATIERRFDTHHSDAGRATRVNEAVTRVAERPLTGFGTPLPSQEQGGPSVGTHGQLWLMLFTQGYPGAVVFSLFVLGVGAFALRSGPIAEPLLAGTVVLAAQSFYYEWMATQVVLLLGLLGATAAAVQSARNPRVQRETP